MLDTPPVPHVISDADTFCPLGPGDLCPQWLTVADVVARRGPRGPSPEADERSVRRILARWGTVDRDRTGHPYPRTRRRRRPDGRGEEWVVRADDLELYLPDWRSNG